jgi:very-short-patch-repair endonuclease
MKRLSSTYAGSVASTTAARVPRKREKSKYEELFALSLKDEYIPFEREYKFHPQRKWLADFALVPQLILIEIEGGTHSGGRHVRPAGYEKDCEKYNAATLGGWRVLRFTSRMVRSGAALQTTLELLGRGG